MHFRARSMKVINKFIPFLVPRVRDMIFVVVVIGSLLLGPRMLNGDLGRHLTLGKYMVSTLSIPSHDLFSFTKLGQPRPPYEWLAQVMFYLLYSLLNLDGVVLLTAFILALAFLFVYTDALHRSNLPIMASLLALWAAAASSLDWLTRPHIFSFLFFAIWVRWLEKIRTGEKIALWGFPVLMLLWANTHGGFIFGILAWAAYLAGWLWETWQRSSNPDLGRKLLLVGGASLIATILTPDLWRNWQGVLGNNSIYVLSHTSETMPPNFGLIGTLPFTALLVVTFVFVLLGWKGTPASYIFLLIGFTAMSLDNGSQHPILCNRGCTDPGRLFKTNPHNKVLVAQLGRRNNKDRRRVEGPYLADSHVALLGRVFRILSNEQARFR